MKRRLISTLLVVVALAALVPPAATAQPLFTSVHDWTIDTPAGPVGYQQVRQDPGAMRQHYLLLGPRGRVWLTAGHVAGVVSPLLIVLAAVIALSIRRRRRRA